MLRSRWLFPFRAAKGDDTLLKARHWRFNAGRKAGRAAQWRGGAGGGWPSLNHLLVCFELFPPAIDSITEGLSVLVLSRAELSQTGMVLVALLFAMCATRALAREFR